MENMIILLKINFFVDLQINIFSTVPTKMSIFFIF